jgi:hypothetical protein
MQDSVAKLTAYTLVYRKPVGWLARGAGPDRGLSGGGAGHLASGYWTPGLQHLPTRTRAGKTAGVDNQQPD